MTSLKPVHGFTLIETLVATAVLVTALAGVAQLLVLSAQWSRAAAGANVAILAAQEKLEELRGAPFGYDEADQLLTADGLVSSEDAVGDGVLTRRWSVEPFGEQPPDAVTIEVCVFRTGSPVPESCLATIRTRQS